MLSLVGNEHLRTRFATAVARGSLPASLLLYGPAGTGKERLALWLAARILCSTPDATGAPCGQCRDCTYVDKGAHPDLQWYFPLPKNKRKDDPDVDEVLEEYREAISERVSADGPWEPADPKDGLFVSTVRAIVNRAALTPAFATHKVIVVADADRMVPQEGSEAGANAFLKLLEEPPRNTIIILTSSVPASLLPTIRSRSVAVRVPPLSRDAIAALGALGVRHDAPGANPRAKALLNAALGSEVQRLQTALGQGMSGARGAYSDALDALAGMLHERARDAATRGDDAAAYGAARAVAVVEQVRRHAYQNVNPQILTARLLRDLAPLLS